MYDDFCPKNSYICTMKYTFGQVVTIWLAASGPEFESIVLKILQMPLKNLTKTTSDFLKYHICSPISFLTISLSIFVVSLFQTVPLLYCTLVKLQTGSLSIFRLSLY